MKKIKNTFKSAIMTAALLSMGCAAFTGCQMGLVSDAEAQGQTKNVSSARYIYTEAERDEMKKIVKDGVKEYNDENKKPDKFKYEGYEGALTKITAYGLEKLVDYCGIEDDRVKSLVDVGTGILNAGTKFLDKSLDTCSGGLYSVALNIFFPDQKKVDPEIVKVQEGIERIEQSLGEVNESVKNLSNEVMCEADRTILTNRINDVIKYKNDFRDYVDFLGEKEGVVSYKTYLELEAKLLKMNINSPEKLYSIAQTYFDSYIQSAGKSYSKMYKTVAEANCPWRYQSNAMIRDFINSELVTGTTVYTVVNALFNPDNSASVYKEALVGYLLSHDDSNQTTNKLYNAVMDPVKGSNIYTSINEDKYNEFMNYVEKRAAELSEEELDAVTELCLKSDKKWGEFNDKFNSFVNILNNIQITDDEKGQVTCNIPGARYTFSRAMKTVNYGKTFKTYKTTLNNWDDIMKEQRSSFNFMTLYIPDTHDSNALKDSSDWLQIFSGADFEGSKVVNKVDEISAAPKKSVYESILNYYNQKEIDVYEESMKYITVKDNDGNTYRAGIKAHDKIAERTLENILAYDAGIKMNTNLFAVANGDKGFKLEKTGEGDWNIKYVWVAKCSADYVDGSDSGLKTNTFTVMDSYACGNSDSKVSHLYRSHYYGLAYDTSAIHEKAFSVLVPLKAN